MPRKKNASVCGICSGPGVGLGEVVCQPCKDAFPTPVFVRCVQCNATHRIILPHSLEGVMYLQPFHIYYTNACPSCSTGRKLYFISENTSPFATLN